MRVILKIISKFFAFALLLLRKKTRFIALSKVQFHAVFLVTEIQNMKCCN